MNVYLAARYGRRLEMQAVALRIERRGHTVTSRWINGDHDTLDGDATPYQQRLWAEEDIEDIQAAGVLLTFAEAPGVAGAGRGGRHVELGVALGLGLTVIVIGPAENVFHHAEGVIQCSDMGHVLDVLDGMRRTQRATLEAMRLENARMAREAQINGGGQRRAEGNGGRPRVGAGGLRGAGLKPAPTGDGPDPYAHMSMGMDGLP